MEQAIREAADRVGGAFREAARGGRHAGMLQNYAGRSVVELERAKASFEQRIAEHEAWIDAPEKKIRRSAELDPRHQRHLTEKKWPEDIERLREQKGIVERLIDVRKQHG